MVGITEFINFKKINKELSAWILSSDTPFSFICSIKNFKVSACLHGWIVGNFMPNSFIFSSVTVLSAYSPETS